MVHHRCTRCKEDVGEYGTRHKYAQGLFCEKCLRALRGGFTTNIGGWFGFAGRIWHRLVEFVTKPFTHRITVKLEKEATRVTYNVMKARARSIPHNPQGGVPQKS